MKGKDGNGTLNQKWLFAFAAATVSAYFLCFMEWLFFATKPSFLSAASWPDRLTLLWLAPLAIAFPLVVWGLFCRTLGLLGSSLNRAGLAAFRLAIASLLTGTFLLALDNFTLTVMGFGIQHAEGFWAAPYGIVIGLMVLAAWWRLSVERSRRQRRTAGIVALLCLGVSLPILVIGMANRQASSPPVVETGSGSSPLPNIILLSSDGLSASNLSLYGYSRDTTPFLRQLEEETLFCENAFSNVSSTGGSMTSMLTGKLPTETRVLYPPDILRGPDAFEHLPVILRGRGYHSLHLSIRHYADPYDLNFQESFDYSNGQSRKRARIIRSSAGLLGIEAAYFLGQSWDRITSRLLHLSQIQAMPDVYAEVTEPQSLIPRDHDSVARLIYFLENSPQPFFAQLHLMGTHGPKFQIQNRVYSEGQEQSSRWMTDFYDDAILAFDGYAAKIVNALRDRNLLDRTVLVIHSDHARRFQTGVRIPLLFRFPNAAHAGRIRANVQLLDIAPTLLDYLGIEPPGWMTGRSLISSQLDPLQPIMIATQRAKKTVKRGRVYEIDPIEAGPPFFSMGRIRTAICSQLFTLDLESFEVSTSRIAGHTAPCPASEIPASAAAQNLLITHLAAHGYDTAAVPWAPLRQPNLLGQIENFVEEMRLQGVAQPEIQSEAWENWGEEVVQLFNAKNRAGERVPAWVRQMIDWAEARSRIEVVQREPVVQLGTR